MTPTRKKKKVFFFQSLAREKEESGGKNGKLQFLRRDMKMYTSLLLISSPKKGGTIPVCAFIIEDCKEPETVGTKQQSHLIGAVAVLSPSLFVMKEGGGNADIQYYPPSSPPPPPQDEEEQKLIRSKSCPLVPLLPSPPLPNKNLIGIPGQLSHPPPPPNDSSASSAESFLSPSFPQRWDFREEIPTQEEEQEEKKV